MGLEKTGKIVTKEEVAKDTFSIKIAVEGLDKIEFEAGQFITLKVAENKRRSYSVASPPQQNTIELIADTVHGGPGSQFFINARIGDVIEFIGPVGKFTYQDGNTPVYFLATGTGVVPFMSMIAHALKNLKTTRRIHLLLGFRYQEQIFKQQYFAELAEAYENFSYTISLTKPGVKWPGETGRIYEHFNQIENHQNAHAYICGSRAMVDDVNQRLLDLGFVKDNIHFEKF